MLERLERLPIWQKARELGEIHLAPLIAQTEAVARAYLPFDPYALFAASLAAMALVMVLCWRFFRRRRAGVPVDFDTPPRTTRRARLLAYLSSIVLLAALAASTSLTQLQEVIQLTKTHVAPLLGEVEATARAYLPASQYGRISAALTVFVLTLFLFWRIANRRKAEALEDLDLPRVTRSARGLGYLSSFVMLAVFAAWASIAQLASASIAPGVVSPEGYRKTVQHLEGGIVQHIHVKDGQMVDAGETLVTLDATQALAQHRELRDRFADLLAMEARLVAEQTGAREMTVPAELKAMADVDSRRAIADQVALFDSHRTALDGRQRILQQRVLQVQEEIAGLGEMIGAQVRQIELLDREIQGVQKLYESGLERLPRILALQRAKAEVETEKAANRARVARDHEEIGETQMQMIAIRDQDNERIDEDLTKVRGALAELRSQLVSKEDILSRTKILAPISGSVMNLKVTTESGVIRPGDGILDIVPENARLIIDARVRPADIDNVRPGMKTRVLLTAYRQRLLPQIYGVVQSVSGDILFDDHSRNSYFLAKVDVEPESLKKLEDVQLVPGMPAEVMILNGEQTFLRYMFNPLYISMTKSFREN